MPDTTRRIGAAQLAEVYLDTAATLERDLESIERAGDDGLDLLVFPEFHLGGSPHWYQFDDDRSWDDYYVELFENAVEVPGPEVERLCEAAAAAGTAVVMGITERAPNTAGTMYNSLVFIDADGTLLGRRRKLVPTIDERLFHTGGTGADVRTFDSSVGTLGGLMCSEHHNPLAVFSMAALGEELHAATWPAFAWWDRETRGPRINVRSRYHAFSTGVPTVSAVGIVDDALADALGQPDWGPDSGGSSVISTEGDFLAGPKWAGEGLVVADVDLRDRTRSKAIHDIVGHYNRFDVFSLTIDRSAHEPVRFVDDDAASEDGTGPGAAGRTDVADLAGRGAPEDA